MPSNEMYAREIINAQALDSNRVKGALVSISKETHDFAHLLYLEDDGIPLVFFRQGTRRAGYRQSDH